MAEAWIAWVWCSPDVERKLRHKHALTPSDVNEAVCLGHATSARWDDDPVRGRRLYVEGTTARGRRILVVLVPLHGDDPGEGAWECRTAYPI